MFGSDIIDAVIALAFIYFLLSLVASAVQESFAQWRGWRWKNLQSGIDTMLSDPILTELVYGNPLIRALGTEWGSNPSYIKNTRFAAAVVDSLTQRTAEAGAVVSAATASIDTVKAGLATLDEDSPARRQLETLIRESGGELEKLELKIATWFDDGMERLSGVYARNARKVLFTIGLIFAVVFNLDTLATAQILATNPASRDAVVASVSTVTEAGAQGTTPEKAIELLNDLELGIGWDSGHFTPAGLQELPGYALPRIPGWLFTAFAVTLGAPFWFDTLMRFSNIRAAGVKPKSVEEQAAEKSK
jgi:hypothetical protein